MGPKSENVLFCSSGKAASGPFSPKVTTQLVPRASHHGPLRPHALKNFFESNLNSKVFHEVYRITVRAGTAHGMSGIITFGEEDPEATLLATIACTCLRLCPEEYLTFPVSIANKFCERSVLSKTCCLVSKLPLNCS